MWLLDIKVAQRPCLLDWLGRLQPLKLPLNKRVQAPEQAQHTLKKCGQVGNEPCDAVVVPAVVITPAMSPTTFLACSPVLTMEGNPVRGDWLVACRHTPRMSTDVCNAWSACHVADVGCSSALVLEVLDCHAVPCLWKGVAFSTFPRLPAADLNTEMRHCQQHAVHGI